MKPVITSGPNALAVLRYCQLPNTLCTCPPIGSLYGTSSELRREHHDNKKGEAEAERCHWGHRVFLYVRSSAEKSDLTIKVRRTSSQHEDGQNKCSSSKHLNEQSLGPGRSCAERDTDGQLAGREGVKDRRGDDGANELCYANDWEADRQLRITVGRKNTHGRNGLA